MLTVPHCVACALVSAFFLGMAVYESRQLPEGFSLVPNFRNWVGRFPN